MKLIALIPCRSGSKGVPGKNTRPIAGHPLVAYTIAAAKQSGVFGEILLTTDSYDTGRLAKSMGIKATVSGPPIHTDDCTDFMWVSDALKGFPEYDFFAILRPTSPFRQPETIRRAWREMQVHPYASALKSVCRGPSPYKAWVAVGQYLEPLLNAPSINSLPPYECPRQLLDTVWQQDGCIDIARTRNVTVCHNVLGAKIIPFYTHGHEGLDINSEADWLLMEKLIETGAAQLPEMGGE